MIQDIFIIDENKYILKEVQERFKEETQFKFSNIKDRKSVV